MASYQRKQGDTVTITEQLLDPDTDEALDVSGADSVRMFMEHAPSGDVVVDGSVTLQSDGSDGWVSKDVSSAAIARAGRYRLDFFAEFPSGRKVSYPDDGSITLQAADAIGRQLPDPIISIQTEAVDDAVAVEHVQSESDLQGKTEGFYLIEGPPEQLVYFDGDYSTN